MRGQLIIMFISNPEPHSKHWIYSLGVKFNWMSLNEDAVEPLNNRSVLVVQNTDIVVRCLLELLWFSLKKNELFFLGLFVIIEICFKTEREKKYDHFCCENDAFLTKAAMIPTLFFIFDRPKMKKSLFATFLATTSSCSPPGPSEILRACKLMHLYMK